MNYKKESIENLKEKVRYTPIIGVLAESLYRSIFNLWRSRKNLVFYIKNKRYLSRNIELKNSERGEGLFVLACGPSINQQNLKPLKDELCISVNNFFVHPDFNIIKPKYHIFPGSHSPLSDDQYVSWFQEAEKYFPKDQIVFVSVTDKYMVDNNKLFSNQKIYYYYSVGEKQIRDVVDMTKNMPAIDGIVQTAMLVGFYLGVKKINLIGCDHNLPLNLGNYKHFYEKDAHMVVKKGYKEWSHSDWGWHFKKFGQMWDNYRNIKKYADRHKISVYNSTLGGLLDIFPRQPLEEAIGEIKKDNIK